MRIVHLGLGTSTLVCAALAMSACADTDTVGGGGEGGVINVSTGVGGSGQSSSSSNTSASTSASTTSASSTTSSSTSASSTSSGPPPCDDTGPSEPGNDTRAGAHYLGEIGDNDSQGGTFNGVLSSMGEVDWYRYDGEDNLGYVVDPTRTLMGPGLRLCKYIQCKSGNLTLTCPSNTSPDTVDGLAGCCWTGNVEVEIPSIDCSGTTSEDTNVFIRIDATSPVDCVPYSVAFHY
jgi:hypothetical protein